MIYIFKEKKQIKELKKSKTYIDLKHGNPNPVSGFKRWIGAANYKSGTAYICGR